MYLSISTALCSYLFFAFLQEMQAHIDKINEMASVMRKAIEVDDGRTCEDEERIKQLEVKANVLPCSTCTSNNSKYTRRYLSPYNSGAGYGLSQIKT